MKNISKKDFIITIQVTHYDEQNSVGYSFSSKRIFEDLLHTYASDLIGELSNKYGYKPMSLDEFQMEYEFDEDDAKNIDDLLKLHKTKDFNKVIDFYNLEKFDQ